MAKHGEHPELPDHLENLLDTDVHTIFLKADCPPRVKRGTIGQLELVEIETEGETLAKDEVFGTIEAVKTVSDLFMPLSGEIKEFNSELEANPELVNSDPYGKGWMVKVRFSDASEMEDLLSSEDYKSLIGA